MSAPTRRPHPGSRAPTRGPLARLRRLVARLPARLLAFNLLLVLVPITGLFYFGLHQLLGRYERRLLDGQERSMAQQGRLLAAALSDRPAEPFPNADAAPAAAEPVAGLADGPLDADTAEGILAGLEQRLTARLRVYDVDGRLLADSSRLGPRRDELDAGSGAAAYGEGPAATEDSWLYRFGAAPFRVWRRWFRESGETSLRQRADSQEPTLPAAVRSALAGRYGAETRPTPGDQGSLTLHVAIPVRSSERVIGVALASQSTYRILEELRAMRLSFFEVFLASLAGAILLSVVAATTIARPIRRLRAEAASLVDRRGRLRGTFSGSDKLDEVGDLARALERLSSRVEEHLRFVESFAADVSHELKNPLTSIRAANELLAEATDRDERRRLLGTVASEVARMERLLSAVREISLIDSMLDREMDQPETPPVELGNLLRALTDAARLRADQGGDSVEVALELPPEPVLVAGAPERLAQVVENLIDNAVGFSAIGSRVLVRLFSERSEDGFQAVLVVADRGPGIPQEHVARVFDRFFTYRPASGAPQRGRRQEWHTGLGLSIVAAIVDAYGGRVTAANRPGGGAELTVRLPAVPPAPAGGGRTQRTDPSISTADHETDHGNTPDKD